MVKKFSIFLVVLILSLEGLAFAKVPYHATLRQWTEGDNVYSRETFEARLIWKATYLSPEFVGTAREKIDEWKKKGPFEGAAPYPSYLASSGEGEFLISVYTPKGTPAIDEEADNFWEFQLELPTGESYSPSSIESLRVTQREARLFPYVNKWSTFYRVTFPVGHLDRPFRLALRSAGATSFLKWK